MQKHFKYSILCPFKMINAEEILRYTNAGWKETDIKQIEKYFKPVTYPVDETKDHPIAFL